MGDDKLQTNLQYWWGNKRIPMAAKAVNSVQVRHICLAKKSLRPPRLIQWALVQMPNGTPTRFSDDFYKTQINTFYANIASAFDKKVDNFVVYYYDGMTTYKLKDGAISFATGTKSEQGKTLNLTHYYISDMIFRTNTEQKAEDGKEKPHFFFIDKPQNNSEKPCRPKNTSNTYNMFHGMNLRNLEKSPSDLEALEKTIKKEDSRQKLWWGKHVRETGSASAWKV